MDDVLKILAMFQQNSRPRRNKHNQK